MLTRNQWWSDRPRVERTLGRRAFLGSEPSRYKAYKQEVVLKVLAV
jgi:hypothetical protein